MKEKKFNYFYKTENLINGNFYYGVHSSNDLEDGYLGSGKRIKYAIKKYGFQNFKNEKLLFFNSFNEALNFESEFVTEEFVIDPSCYNLKTGGMGGFTSEEHRQKFIDGLRKQGYINGKINGPKIAKIVHEKLKNDPIFKQKWLKNLKKGLKEHKHQQGNRNSQYGTKWITNGKENKKIHKEDLIPDGWNLGRSHWKKIKELKLGL